MKKIIFALVLAAVSMYAQALWAADLPYWELSITVSMDKAENRLVLGHCAGATNNADPAFDVPAMLTGDVMAFFKLGQKSYWRDMRGADCMNSGVCKWPFYTRTSVKGGTVTVGWDPAKLPATGRFYLYDPITKGKLDMRTNQAVKYFDRGVVRKFVVLWYKQ